MVAMDLITLEDYINKTYDLNVTGSDFSALINSNFYNNVGQTASAISIYDSNLRLLSSEELRYDANFYQNVSPDGSTIYASGSQLFA